MRADQAYAAGIDGQGVKIGEMDSGFDPSHPDTPASRYQPVTASGTYVDGTPFSVSGAMNGNNDSHGTHVGGTLGASRDGVGMHGVAYAAQVYVANTNQNDSFLFGPTPDPNYFKAAYQALADAGVRAINNSWGSQPKDVSYETLDGLHAAYAQHYGRSTWLDAAAGVSRQGVINVFSAGNSGYANASVRSALPYFQPDLEGHWLAVSGLDQQNGQRYNRCGIAKYWCITTPGRLINSTMPGGGYANKSGTSMAAPHATGALATGHAALSVPEQRAGAAGSADHRHPARRRRPAPPPTPSAGACRISVGRCMGLDNCSAASRPTSRPACATNGATRFPIAPCSSARPRTPPSTRPGSGR